MNNPSPQFPREASLGLNLVAGMIVFSYLGHLADKRFDISPWGLLSGMFLGLFYGGYEVWKIIRSDSDRDEKK